MNKEMARSNLHDLNWEPTLKRWSLEQGTHMDKRGNLICTVCDVFYHPAMSIGAPPDPPAPEWRGKAVKKFRKHPPPPGYEIRDRLYTMVCSFPGRETLSETEDEEEESDDDEEEVKKEVQVKKPDELESESESESVDVDYDYDDEEVNKQEYESEDEDEDKNKEVKKTEYESEDEDEDENETIEDLLDEVQEYAKLLDVGRLLNADELLFPFLREVFSSKRAATIRAKGAELVTTMVQNYPMSQQLVIKEKGLHRLLRNFTIDLDATSRTKTLGAISSLIRNNNSGITEFRRESGYVALKNALVSRSVCPREVLNLIQYLLHENSSDCNIVTELGIPLIMMQLAASNDDLEVREAALSGLLILARDGGNSGQLLKDDDKLKRVLQERIEGISAMAPEDLGAARVERQLVDSLWNACYNEPSSLGEKGLLVLPGEDEPAPVNPCYEPSSLGEKGLPVLPGEDEPAPDVATKLFEPLRACAAAQAYRHSVTEKDCNIITVLGLPRIMIHLVSSDDAEVREAALRGLLVLTRDEEGGNSGQLVKNDDKLKRVLQERIDGISAMALEDLGAAREERQLVDSLWNACYNEPSSLGEKGLLVLPGEDAPAPAPDVASKLFEPSLRACAAAQAVDRNSVSDKKEAPLLLGLGPSSASATPTVQSDSSSKRRKLH